MIYFLLLLWFFICMFFTYTLLSLFIIKYIESKKYYRLSDDEKFNYYRDIIKNFSIGELGYVFNNKDINTLIKADLEKLKLERKIDIIDNKLIVLDKSNLSSSELFIVDSYKFINTFEFNKIYKERIISSLKDKGILKRFSFGNQFMGLLVFVFGFLTLTLFFSFFFIKTNDLPKNIYVLDAILFVYSWFLSVFSIRMMLKVSYVLTKEGKDIYVRLNGLKHYLDDFGRFDEKELREIVLWEDYILYAIILGESDKLENELINKNFI